MNEVVLVDRSGTEVGRMAKRAAHEAPGHLHRAFSLFLRRGDGRLLLQRRASNKYHFADIWANACCSHPRPGEDLEDAVRRRSQEELGIECDPSPVGVFIYRAADPVSGLVEHERDHVFMATVDVDPVPDPAEVADWEWVTPQALISRIDSDDRSLAPWLVEAIRHFPRLVEG